MSVKDAILATQPTSLTLATSQRKSRRGRAARNRWWVGEETAATYDCLANGRTAEFVGCGKLTRGLLGRIDAEGDA
jgi:hypothetical protein